MKFIHTNIDEYLNENITPINNINFNLFPEDILNTLKNEYGHFYKHKFDWNDKMDEFIENDVYDGDGFRKWILNNELEEFIKNLDKIIIATRQDLILKIKQKNAERALERFEKLIIPSLGNEVLVKPLSKFMEFALLNLHNTEEIERAYKEAKDIIDSDGSLNHSKIEASTIFDGESINLPNFENFIIENPEYKGLFNDWKKLFDKYMELSSTDLNAFRNSTPYMEIRNLYDFLIKLRKGKRDNK